MRVGDVIRHSVYTSSKFGKCNLLHKYRLLPSCSARQQQQQQGSRGHVVRIISVSCSSRRSVAATRGDRSDPSRSRT